jgi:hypothetical protein
MFFTRDSKHKIQQDTYIQRARMFGSRRAHLSHFELTIPAQLYVDWHRCFVFHKLALEAIKEKMGSPVWLADQRIAAVAPASIDKANVSLDKGEMSYPIFEYKPQLESIIEGNAGPIEKLRSLQKAIGTNCLPEYLIRYVSTMMPNGDESVAIHRSDTIERYTDKEGLSKERVERKKGFMGQVRRDFPNALHHFKIFYNGRGGARVFYKFNGSITFIENLKNARRI